MYCKQQPVPTGTGCFRLFERIGNHYDGGTTYYIADKEMFHAGLDCVSNPNYEPLLDTQVYQIVYNDQTAFENDFVLAERARNAYAN